MPTAVAAATTESKLAYKVVVEAPSALREAIEQSLSLVTDLRILMATIRVVLRGTGY